MYLFQRILRAVRRFKREQRPQQGFNLDVETLRSLELIAEDEQRTPEEIANRMLSEALRGRQAQKANWERWNSLTPREQQIAALVCLNYTSRQIASKLYISPETVKTHVEHVLVKFGVPDRMVLRLALSEWDFSAWDPDPDPRD